MIKGTDKGTSTSNDGSFSLDVKPGDVLIISGVGLKAVEYKVGNSLDLNINVESQSVEMSEVVVTALGIKKDKKKLGYAVQGERRRPCKGA
jgi:hypothetical protein